MDAADRRALDAHMAALADGDRRAFDPVFDLCAPLVRRYALRAMNGADDAEDVAQTALLNMFARASEYDPSRSALPWILGIVANEVRTHRKKAARRRIQEPPRELACSAPSPEDTIVDRDLVQAAEAIMEELSPNDREALEASIGARARPAIAAATFRKRLSRALAKLRTAWKEAHDG
jgi:RNA polymerase sigma-70 factor (ECF subfamily)